MFGLTRDIVHLVAKHIEPIPLTFCELSLVNRTFREVFTSDTVWNRCNVYEVPSDIHKHFIDSLDGDKTWLYLIQYSNYGNWHLDDIVFVKTPITELTDNMYVWLQCFLTIPKDSEYGWLWPESIPEIDFFCGIAIQACPDFANSYGSQLKDNRYVMHKLLTASTCYKPVVKVRFMESELAAERDFCRSVVENVHIYDGHPYQYFRPEVKTDPEIMDFVYAFCPEIITKAMGTPNNELIKKYMPTEEIFKSLIRGKGWLVARYMPFYDSCEVLHAALDLYECTHDDAIVRYYFTAIWSSLRQSHFADRELIAKLIAVSPWFFSELPIELKTDSAVVLATLKSLYLDPTPSVRGDNLLLIVNDLPDDASVFNDRDVVFALLMLAYTELPADVLSAKKGLRDQMNILLRDYDSAIALLETSAFWFEHIQISITAEVVKTLVSYHATQSITMKFSLPAYCLENGEILKYGAGVFKNILKAPEHLFTRDIVMENITAGGSSHVSLPKRFKDDPDLFRALIQADLCGPVKGLQRFQGHFNKAAIFDWKVLKIFFGGRLAQFIFCEARRSPGIPLCAANDPLFNLLGLMETAQVRDMMLHHGPENGISHANYLTLLSDLRRYANHYR